MNRQLFLGRVSFTTGKILLAALVLTLSNAARAQWIFTSSNSPWLTEAATQYWNNNVINDRFTGTNGTIINQQTLSNISFDAGSTVINLNGFDARKLVVGTFISGDGIPAGATIAAINNAGQITISAPTLSASGGPLTVSGWGAYNGYGTLQQNVVLNGTTDSNVLTLPAGFNYSTIKLGQRVVGGGIDTNITAIDTAANTITVSKLYTGATGTVGFNFVNLNWDIWLSGTHTLTGDFVYLNTDPYNISFTPSNANAPGLNNYWHFTAPVTNIVADVGGSGTQRSFSLGSASRGITFNFHGGDVNLIIDPSTNLGSNYGQNGKADIAYLNANAINIGSLTKSGAGTLYVGDGNEPNQNLTVSGAVTITGGQLILSSGGAKMTGPRIIGNTRYDIIGPGSALVLRVSETFAGQTAAMPSLAGNAPINMWSGQLLAYSNRALNDLQAVGDVTLRSGRNSIGIADSDPNFVLSLNSLTRENNATLNIVGRAIGSGSSNGTYLKVVNDANILGSLVGGGGVSGGSSKTVSIIPWAVVHGASIGISQGDPNTYAGNGLVTYTSADGFRELLSTEYDTTFAAATATGAYSNLWLNVASTNLAAAQTVNALRINAGATLTVNDTLTLNSGVLVKNSNNNAEAVINGSGAVSSGTAPMYIYGYGNFNLSAQLVNTYSGTGPGLILAQPQLSGTTILKNANSYGGFTLVQGAVALQASGAITNSELRVDLGGLVKVDAAGLAVQVTKLSGNGAVNFSAVSNQLNIGGAAGTDGAVTVNAGGILAPGDAVGQLQAGTLLLGDKVDALVFKKDSFLDLDIASGALSDMIQSLNPDATLTFSDGAIIRLNFLNSYTPADDVSWLLSTGFDTLNLGGYLIQDQNGNPLDNYTLTNVNNNLMLNFSTIPEPSALWLTVSGLALLAFLRRRR